MIEPIERLANPEEQGAIRLYGLLAELPSADDLLAAARKTREAGYRCFDAYAPVPVVGMAAEMGAEEERVPWIVFWGGIAGGVGGFGLLTYLVVFDFPLNIGGRPLFDWPTFVPITFELTVLCAALAGFAGFFILNRLPMPYHPVLAAPELEEASEDRFYLCIEARDPRFQEEQTRAFLEALGAAPVTRVEGR